MPEQAQEVQSGSNAIPAPIGGWNARDPLTDMAPEEAIVLENLFPDTGEVKIRNGFTEHADPDLGVNPIKTLATFNDVDGTAHLFAFGGNEIWDVTTATESDETNGQTITGDEWSWIVHGKTLLVVNGLNQPLKWTSGVGFEPNLFTGIADDSVLVHINSYRERLYLTEKDSQSVWYGGVSAIAGAVTELDLQYVLKRGGHILFTTTWSRDSGTGLDDMLVIATSAGEILVYAGSFPGGVDWQRVGQFFLPSIIGRRGFLHYQGDLLIITEEGPIPMSQLMATSHTTDYRALTDLVDQAFTAQADNYSSNFGWEAILYPVGHMVLFNIPVGENVTSEQFVMNTLTGSWCKFTGINASSWVMFNGKPYFGGMDGKVYEFDSGNNDAGAAISWKVKTAFNYLGDTQRVKHFYMVQPLIRAVQAVTVALNIDVDFGNDPITDTVAVTGTGGSPWDTSPWDTSPWDTDNDYTNDWYGVSGVGRAVSVKMEGDFKDLFWAFTSINIIYEPGGYL
jgi:hypothetical protein